MQITPANVDEVRDPIPEQRRSPTPWIWRAVIAAYLSMHLGVGLNYAVAAVMGLLFMLAGRFSMASQRNEQNLVLMALLMVVAIFILAVRCKTIRQMTKRAGLTALASVAITGGIVPGIMGSVRDPTGQDWYGMRGVIDDEVTASMLALGVVCLGVSFAIGQLSKRGVRLPSAKSSAAALRQIGVLPDPVASPSTKKCPFCAETIQQEAKFCRFCQHDLVPAAPPYGETAGVGQ